MICKQFQSILILTPKARSCVEPAGAEPSGMKYP